MFSQRANAQFEILQHRANLHILLLCRAYLDFRVKSLGVKLSQNCRPMPAIFTVRIQIESWRKFPVFLFAFFEHFPVKSGAGVGFVALALLLT